MEIKGFIGLSLVDWDGMVSSVIFLPGCNMRCPYCYNIDLVLHPERLETIPWRRVEEYLTQKRDFIDGVVLLGGEPTIHPDLPELCQKIKGLGLLVKLDTNGSNPDMIRRLMDGGLVDFVAMDIKAPLNEEKYSRATGVRARGLLGRIRESINLLMNGRVDYEFRTTLVPTLHTPEDVREICQTIQGCRKYVLQRFRVEGGTIDPNFSRLKSFSDREMNAFLKEARRIIPNTILRG